MLSLIVIILFSLAIAFFATQNTNGITVVLANSPVPGIPVYMVVIASILLGLLVGWIMSFFGTVSSFFNMRKKDSTIDAKNSKIGDLAKRANDLEVENARLKSELSAAKPGLVQRILPKS